MAERQKEKSLGKFSVTVNGGTVIERCFPIDQYNPETRYSIQLKEMADSIIEQILDSLRLQELTVMYDKIELKPKEKWVGKTGKTYKRKD